MNLVHKIETWGNTHHPIVLDPFRIALGGFLLFKGVSFMNNAYTLHAMIVNQNVLPVSDSVLMVLIHIAAFINLVGGIMILLGVATRIACLIQIPIVLGAVILNNSVSLPGNNELWLSIAVLVMLVVFSVIGSGKISIERILENENSMA